MADIREKVSSLHPEQANEITGLVEDAKNAERPVHTISEELTNYREIPSTTQDTLGQENIELPKTYYMHSAQEIESILNLDRDSIDQLIGMANINRQLKLQRDKSEQDAILNEIRISGGNIKNLDAIREKIQQRILESAIENSLYSSENIQPRDSQIRVELETYQDALREINARYQSGTPSNPEQRDQYYKRHTDEIRELKEKYGSCDYLLVIKLEQKRKEKILEVGNKESVMSIHDHAIRTAQEFKSHISQN